jgi:hypothetical protein
MLGKNTLIFFAYDLVFAARLYFLQIPSLRVWKRDLPVICSSFRGSQGGENGMTLQATGNQVVRIQVTE